MIRYEARSGRARRIVASLVFMSLLLCQGVFSEGDKRDIAALNLENLLDDIVLSASKHAETLEESPANVFLITREMIDDYGCRTISEALSLVPGIYITDDYSLSQIGVRGISLFGDWNSHIMVLVDGRPTNEQYGGTSSIEVPGVNIDNVERIEVVKGPSSSLYGSNAFLGIINLITRVPKDNSLAASSTYDAGVDGKTLSLNFFQRFNNGLSVFSTGTIYDQDGNRLFFDEFSDINNGSMFRLDDNGLNQYYIDSSEFTGGVARNHNTMENYSTYNRFNWRGLYLTLQLAKLNTGVAQSMWGSVFNRPENRFKERHSFAEVGYQGGLSENVDLTARLSYTSYRWSDHILYNYASEDPGAPYLPGPVWADLEFDRFLSTEAKFDFAVTDRYQLIVGSEAQFHEIRHESGETDAGGENVIANVIPEKSVADNGQIYNLYAQNEYAFSDKIKAVAGVHFNYYTYTTGRVMPKAALIVRPYSHGTLKFIVGRGFRSPTFYEMSFDDGWFYIGNPDLKPEMISSHELIAALDFPYGITAEAAGSYNHITDLISQTVVSSGDPAHPGGDYLDEVSQFRNRGKMRASSVELSLMRNPVYRMSGFFNLTWQKLEVLEGEQGTMPYNSPRWISNAGFVYQVIPGRLSGSTRANFISSRYLWDQSRLSDNFTVDLMLNARKILGYFEITAGVKNILDRENRVPLSHDYAPSTSIQRPGRALFIRLTTTAGW